MTTWRTFLDNYCHSMKAEEKLAFANALGVSKTTINRWRRGKDTPRAQHMERLIAIIPMPDKRTFLALLKKDPHLWSLLPASHQERYSSAIDESLTQLGIFSLKVLRLQRDTTNRLWNIASAILHELQAYLEPTPGLGKVEILLSICMPPHHDGQVHSLRTFLGTKEPPLSFMGKTDLSGYAATSRRGVIIPDTRNRIAPVRPVENVGSAMAFPVMYEHRVAGVLQATSPAPQFFTHEQAAILEICADMMRLAFFDTQFYENVDLAIMPPSAEQQPYIVQYIDAKDQNTLSPEKLVQLESVLLQLTTPSQGITI